MTKERLHGLVDELSELEAERALSSEEQAILAFKGARQP
jgi:hypothetical protein